MIEELTKRVLDGYAIDEADAKSLLDTDKETLYQSAERITRHFGKPEFNPCGIINARAGKCSENCKWCAQSAHFHTGADEHGVISSDIVMQQALHDQHKGVKRFSLVTSGRAVTGRDLDHVCETYQRLRQETGMFLCGSLGLLSREALQKLWDAGVRRYHCNLETAPSYFSQLCTTHTIEDKMRTLRWAREIGFEICSGGIIGMGETMEQRIELAFTLREIAPDSIPINILCPIKGTPLADTPPISDEDILTTIALFRFIHPKAELRFAGGRARLSRATQLRALKIGINSAVVGDLLTTIGSKIDDDKRLVNEAGYSFD